MPAIPIIAAVAGGAIAADSSRKAANTAADAAKSIAANSKVDIGALQTQAQQIARDNAANSAALENQYNPGASALRSGSLQSLLASLNQGSPTQDARNTAYDGGPGTNPLSADLMAKIAAQAGTPLATTGFDSGLTRDAVAAAQRDLALGGSIPLDVQNAAARHALATAGTVGGNGSGLGLGRDLVARDLGLTSLDLYNKRLANASTIGAQEAALNQANAQLAQNAEQYGRNSLGTAASALGAYDAQNAANYFNTANRSDQNYWTQQNFMQNIANGNFSRALSAAQFGQNIAAPASGLDPGSVANIAIGNQNAGNAAAQNAAALKVGAANQTGQFGSQILGAALPAAFGAASSYFGGGGTGGYTPAAGSTAGYSGYF